MKKSVWGVLIAMVIGTVVSVSPTASAQEWQWGDIFGKKQNDPYGKTGQYGKANDPREIERLIVRANVGSDRFKSIYDRDVDRSKFDKRPIEDRLWEDVKALKTAMGNLERNYKRTKSIAETRNDAITAMRTASGIDKVFKYLPISTRVYEQWYLLRRDMNSVADTYDLPRL